MGLSLTNAVPFRPLPRRVVALLGGSLRAEAREKGEKGEGERIQEENRERILEKEKDLENSEVSEVSELQPVVITAGQDLEKTSFQDYEAMRDDRLRTDSYAAAIRQRVTSGARVVLDLGTGPFALLATIAARAGARKVYAIERTPYAAAEARKTVSSAGLEDVISVIEGNSQDVKLPEKVDLIVSELVGNVATGEGVVETIRDARRRFLRDDLLKDPEAMIPSRCQTAIAPVMYTNHELLAAKGPEFVQRPFKLFSETTDLLFLAKPQLLEDFDLCSSGRPGVDDLRENEHLVFDTNDGDNDGGNEGEKDGDKRLDVSSLSFSTASSLSFSGFALWPRVVVDEGRGLVVDVQNAASHWSYVVALMSPKRLVLPKGQRIGLESHVDLRKVPYVYTLRGSFQKKAAVSPKLIIDWHVQGIIWQDLVHDSYRFR